MQFIAPKRHQANEIVGIPRRGGGGVDVGGGPLWPPALALIDSPVCYPSPSGRPQGPPLHPTPPPPLREALADLLVQPFLRLMPLGRDELRPYNHWSRFTSKDGRQPSDVAEKALLVPHLHTLSILVNAHMSVVFVDQDRHMPPQIGILIDQHLDCHGG